MEKISLNRGKLKVSLRERKMVIYMLCIALGTTRQICERISEERRQGLRTHSKYQRMVHLR